MRTAEQASWCGMESSTDATVSSIEHHRLVRVNFDFCPQQRAPPAQCQTGPQLLDRKCMLLPAAREKFQAHLSQCHNYLPCISSEPECAVSSSCSTLRDAADLSFQRVAKKGRITHWIQDDTQLLVRETHSHRKFVLQTRRAIRLRSLQCAILAWWSVCRTDSASASHFSVCARGVAILCKFEAFALRFLERLQYAERCAIRLHRREQWDGVATAAQ